ncbi:MAG TPA: histidine--tRNA ligase, partial [Firmicutes bacterium]|nr:histidine--tRNA ligase [Bacillota bacterium]
MNVNPVKGMREFLPAENRLREHVKSVIMATYEQQGFELISTPAVENIDLLTNSEGGDNLQLIFKILKRGEKLQLGQPGLTEDDLVDLGLRYDLTLPLSRFYANNRSKLHAPFKTMQIGTVYRAERQQRGRYRAFTQCDIDIIAEPSHIAECELIQSTAKVLCSLGFTGFKVKISDRRILSTVIANAGFPVDTVAGICTALDKADKIGWVKVENELLAAGFDQAKVRVLLETIRGLCIEDLESQGVADDIIVPLREVIAITTAQSNSQYEIAFVPTLVRGMGYYTGMVFE